MPLPATSVPVVFITGASSGIGAALAAQYARRGAHLGLVARRGEVLAKLAVPLAQQGARAVERYPLDVADAEALGQAAADFIGKHGAPDVVIANAGVSAGTLTEFREDLDVIKRLFDTNVYGMAATFSPFLSAMQQAGRGRLVGIASVAGIRGLPGAEAYSASKAAAISYLESLRVELRASGIKVVTLAPGYIATPMTAVNPYRMPFLLPVDEAARRFVRLIDRGASYAVVPWPMAVAAKLLRFLPNALYDRITAGAPRKPRSGFIRPTPHSRLGFPPMFSSGYYITAELRVVDPEKTVEAERALIELCSKTLAEPGCSIFQLHKDSSTPIRFLLWERFDDEAAFKRHFEEAHTKAYVALGLTEVVQYFQTNVVSA